MKRIEEKVKDIVEVRSHASLSNFATDPMQTLAGYHFTDATAELMSKWINGALRVAKGNGSGFALAGFRGVGKSHFLAAFGALLAHSEFRSRITDQLVGSAAQGLNRRSYPVAFLRRGSQKTLLAELKAAIAPMIGSEPESLSDSLNELLMRASDSAGDLPLILLIDTAFERTSRVARDDGAVLSEIAETAKSLGIFIGIALDDDISGADGANSAISKSFVIDYLDQEHLYKIVDTHIFPKQSRMQPVLHEIYEYYRSVVPGFRWSEERFRSLYPLHPSIMEIAPFVRLYMHEFALLPFASEAGSRILGRPANSLIAPDEVFDKVEKSLRRIDALKEAFVAFDRINDEIVAKTPVMKRLQAKLILKGLFLFSLNDEGSTASDIGASMLIFDENDGGAAIQSIEAMMSSFAGALPDRIRVQPDIAGNRRYSFILDGKDDLKTALDEAAEQVPARIIGDVLKKLMDDRYADCSFADTESGSDGETTNCVLSWRGGLRKGMILWQDNRQTVTKIDIPSQFDWTAVVQLAKDAAPASSENTEIPVVTWKAADLSEDEIDTIRRYHVLMSDQAVRAEFQDHIAAAIQAHIIAVEKIFQRVFLSDGILSIEGFEYNFTDEARSAQSLSQIFTIMLESLFEGRFPLHPYFEQIIRMKDVSGLVADLFGGARPNLDDVQRMAAIFAVPLGIVTKSNGVYMPAEAESLRELPLVRDILDVTRSKTDEVLSLETIFARLGAAPHGLAREAAYLLLAAMVSGRLLEFVTSNDDRINHRSLDLQLIWSDIIGVASPTDSAYSNDRLVMWASLLTGISSFKSLNKSEDRLEVLDGLQQWLIGWNDKRLAGKFDDVRDDVLNTKIWRLARTSIKAFRIAADSISAVSESSLPVEGCLQRIADAFADTEVEFARLSADLATIEDFISGTELRDEITGWLSLCEITSDAGIDDLRGQLGDAIANGIHSPRAFSNVDLGNLWAKFQRAYSGHFLEQHDRLLATPALREKLSEIQKTDLWWEFENLSVVDAFDNVFRSKAKKIVQQLRRFDCRHDTKEILQSLPACGCGFTLTAADNIETLPEELWKTVNQGLISYRETLRTRKADVINVLRSLTSSEPDESTRQAIADLSDYVSTNKEFRRLSDTELRLVGRAFKEMSAPAIASKHPYRGHGAEVVSTRGGLPEFADTADELNALLEAMPQ